MTSSSSSSGFGELVLVLGDLHIPSRTTKIPPAFQRMLVPNKMQHVICTGNIGSSPEQYDELYNLAPSVHIVAGNYDCSALHDTASTAEFPEIKIVQIGHFKIGIIHGHQLVPWGSPEPIDRFQRKYQVDIVITGHTNKSEVHTKNHYYHINPGSITGAYSPLRGSDDDGIVPSFVLLAVQDTKITCYVYELINGEVEVSKTEFTKHVQEEKILPANVMNPALLDTLLK